MQRGNLHAVHDDGVHLVPGNDLATDVGVTVDRGPTRPSGSYDVSHGTQVLGVDGKNDVPVVWTLGTTAPELAHDIHQVLS